MQFPGICNCRVRASPKKLASHQNILQSQLLHNFINTTSINFFFEVLKIVLYVLYFRFFNVLSMCGGKKNCILGWKRVYLPRSNHSHNVLWDIFLESPLSLSPRAWFDAPIFIFMQRLKNMLNSYGSQIRDSARHHLLTLKAGTRAMQCTRPHANIILSQPPHPLWPVCLNPRKDSKNLARGAMAHVMHAILRHDWVCFVGSRYAADG